ncbi:MAG: YaiI/YqxD family protein [Pseudomonadota bacterium]
MQVWVDADACPVVIKEILFRAAMRTEIPLTLIANHTMRVPSSPWIHFRQVPSGFDVADNEIVQRASAGDLIITSDVPLAAEVIAKGAHVLSPRGERLTKDNIGPRLNMRDFMDSMRSSGVVTGGPPALNQSDKKAFAGELDKLLARAKSKR